MQYTGQQARPEALRPDNSQSDEGRCFVCGRWSPTRRRIVIHRRYDMLIAWVCPDCDILDNGDNENNLEQGE